MRAGAILCCVMKIEQEVATKVYPSMVPKQAAAKHMEKILFRKNNILFRNNSKSRNLS
jgi:hypothetical protein